MEKVTGLRELEDHWSLDDVARANALLDMRAELEQEAIARMRESR
jgi:hypothetical protein